MLQNKGRKPEQEVSVPHQVGPSSYQLPLPLDELSPFVFHSVAHKKMKRLESCDHHIRSRDITLSKSLYIPLRSRHPQVVGA